ncbi:hypothetical protein [Nannocystis pusilla]
MLERACPGRQADAGADPARPLELGGVDGWTVLHVAASQGNADGA